MNSKYNVKYLYTNTVNLTSSLCIFCFHRYFYFGKQCDTQVTALGHCWGIFIFKRFSTCFLINTKIRVLIPYQGGSMLLDAKFSQQPALQCYSLLYDHTIQYCTKYLRTNPLYTFIPSWDLKFPHFELQIFQLLFHLYENGKTSYLQC